MEPWFIEAKFIDSVEVDVCFCIQEELVEPLVGVPIPRPVPSLLRSRDAQGREAELATYYNNVARLARKHGELFSEVRSYFWLRLWIWNAKEQVSLGFPWYDTIEEMVPLLEAMSGSKCGEIFWDQDQGWEMQVHADSHFVYAREWDPDEELVHTMVKIPREAVAAESLLALERIRNIVRLLAQSLGDDVWTRRKREAAFLPTPETRPGAGKKRS